MDQVLIAIEKQNKTFPVIWSKMREDIVSDVTGVIQPPLDFSITSELQKKLGCPWKTRDQIVQGLKNKNDLETYWNSLGRYCINDTISY
jgi:hypothetical protein